MFELVFTRRFSMAHRLLHAGSCKCAVPHGHNEYVTAHLQPVAPAPLDGQANMVLSFDRAKKTWHHFIDTVVDHALQLSEDDPLLLWFQEHEPQHLGRVVVTPGDPTTELMACLLMAKLGAILQAEGGLLRCTRLVLKETPTNTVTFTGDPLSVLPAPRPAEHCWWRRADLSVSDLAGC